MYIFMITEMDVHTLHPFIIMWPILIWMTNYHYHYHYHSNKCVYDLFSVSASLSVCVCLSVCLCAFMLICLRVCMSVCLCLWSLNDSIRLALFTLTADQCRGGFHCKGGEYCIDTSSRLCNPLRRFCVARSLRCDAVPNCVGNDLSDEEGCKSFPSMTSWTPPTLCWPSPNWLVQALHNLYEHATYTQARLIQATKRVTHL